MIHLTFSISTFHFFLSSRILKIFFPLKEEPLSLEDFQEIFAMRKNEKEFWLQHMKQNEDT